MRIRIRIAIAVGTTGTTTVVIEGVSGTPVATAAGMKTEIGIEIGTTTAKTEIETAIATEANEAMPGESSAVLH